MAKNKLMGLKEAIFTYEDGKAIYIDTSFTLFKSDSKKTASQKCEEFVKSFISGYSDTECRLEKNQAYGDHLYIEMIKLKIDGTPESKIVFSNKYYDFL